MIAVIAEQRGGVLNRASWEPIAAAQQLAGAQDVTVVIPGTDGSPLAAELAAAAVREVVELDDPALAVYTPDAYLQALQRLLGELSPSLVLLPHTYQTRDFAPALAARLGRTLITDVTHIRQDGAVAPPAEGRPEPLPTGHRTASLLQERGGVRSQRCDPSGHLVEEAVEDLLEPLPERTSVPRGHVARLVGAAPP